MLLVMGSAGRYTQLSDCTLVHKQVTVVVHLLPRLFESESTTYLNNPDSTDLAVAGKTVLPGWVNLAANC